MSAPQARLARVILLAALSAAAGAAAAVQWQTVASGAGRTVDIDGASIARLKDGKTAAWTRLTLDHPLLDFENSLRYTVVQVLNHYDCAGDSFATQKRIYLRDGREIRTEKVGGPQIMVQPNNIDAQLLAAACRHNGATAKADGKPRVMHAEMVSAATGEVPRSVKVADAAAGEKPRLFDKPLIDKSKVEDPFRDDKGATPAPVPKPLPQKESRAIAATADAASKAAAKAAAPARELSRQERERLLATSGPRKAAPAKPAAPATHATQTARVAPAPAAHAHWDYAGEAGPENWAKLSPEYALCGSGKRQSPIDIRDGIRVDLEPIRFSYGTTRFRVIDNGHAVQVDVGEGSSITVTGRNYRLQQFHFHRPAEESVNGRRAEMVVHLVHRDYAGNLAVVAVQIEKGLEHPLIQTLWNYLPLERGLSVEPPDAAIDLARLLPEQREYYTYMGSLTTPPCTENVLWLVMKQPINVSPDQIDIFARLYPYNARPVQPSFDRLIKESR